LRRATFLVLLIHVAVPLQAQVVRGRVHDASSATPVVGALVSLVRETGDSALVSVLTNRGGEYALRAPGAGTYRLTVKRIGVERFISVAFVLGAGETRHVDAPIAAIAMSLPEVTVSGLCVTRRGELRRIASLWDEARTALLATEISIRDSLIAARITRYAAELDPVTLRVLFDWRSDAEVMTTQPFRSQTGESLSDWGYWRELPDDSVVYLAPDANALLSNEFIRDHCFTLAPAPRGRADLIGLGFAPVRGRKTPDISGTIWLDAKDLELRHIEFRYTALPDIPNAERVGGEVHYTRLGSGAWIVSRWFIRTPQMVAVPDAIKPRQQLYEVGGAVVTDGLTSPIAPARVTGVMRDSSGQPVSGAVVRAIGTHRQVMTDTRGEFSMDSLPPGGLSIAAHTTGYDAFAVLAASRRVTLLPGGAERIDLRAPSSGDIRDEVCSDADLKFIQRARGRGALRILMVDRATTTPMPGVRFVATWPSSWERRDGGAAEGEFENREFVTDARGAATFCDLPIGNFRPVEFALVEPDGSRVPVFVVRFDRNGIQGRVVIGRIQR
jgi:hypothetical protein